MIEQFVSPVVRIEQLQLHYGKVQALAGLDLELPGGCMIGLIDPDGVGKSSLLSLLAGARATQEGRLEVLDGDMDSRQHRELVGPRIAYMPQGLGKNLYPTLSVEENLQFLPACLGMTQPNAGGGGGGGYPAPAVARLRFCSCFAAGAGARLAIRAVEQPPGYPCR